MKFLFTALMVLMLSGCAINSIEKTMFLEPGMSPEQVRGVLGKPENSQFAEGYMVWTYTLQKPWVGYIPHYLAFDQDKKLVSWTANMDEYYANQQLWVDSLPKQHNVTVDGTINHNVDGQIRVR